VTSVAKQQFSKYVSVATDKHATIEELPEEAFSMGSDLKLYKKEYRGQETLSTEAVNRVPIVGS
jgi:hypothetical protein